ncbi:MAG: hypothetical protein MI922_12655 [Bacteroidales bacterium]|nr:hypothetical protein [Bacteroidales bacterium]
MSRGNQRFACPNCQKLGEISLDGYSIRLDDKNVEFIPADCPWCNFGLIIGVKNDKIVEIEAFDNGDDESAATGEAIQRLMMRI